MNEEQPKPSVKYLETRCRVAVRIDWDIISKIKQIYPKTGVFQQISDSLLAGFVNALAERIQQKYGKLDFDPAEFSKCLKHCVITFPEPTGSTSSNSGLHGSPNTLPTPRPEKPVGDVRPRTGKVARKG